MAVVMKNPVRFVCGSLGAREAARQRRERIMKATIGRIVHYWLSDADVTQIAAWQAGEQHHYSNPIMAGDVVPLLVVRVNPDDSVNGQAFVDGNHSVWVASVTEGDGDGHWSWPPQV